MRTKWIIAIVWLTLALVGCQKYDSLPELGDNKYINEIENPVILDSVVAEVQDPTACSLYIYLSFDRSEFEEEWDVVETLDVKLHYLGPSNRPDPALTLTALSEDQWLIQPVYAYTNSSYKLAYSVRLVNGRVSNTLQSETIITPEY